MNRAAYEPPPSNGRRATHNIGAVLAAAGA